jgi:hypothetical protein
MIVRLFIGVGLLALGYFVGKEVGRTESLRAELERRRRAEKGAAAGAPSPDNAPGGVSSVWRRCPPRSSVRISPSCAGRPSTGSIQAWRRLTSVFGTPIEIAFKLLPRSCYKQLHAAADAAIGRAFEVAVSSLHHEHEVDPRNGLYRGLVAVTGAAGGAFGLSRLAFDLPVTTILMLRSIAEIARRKYGQRLVQANDEAIRPGGVVTERRCETWNWPKRFYDWAGSLSIVEGVRR